MIPAANRSMASWVTSGLLLATALAESGCQKTAEPIPVLAWPASTCAPFLAGPDGDPHDAWGAPSRAAVIKGTQIFFAAYLRPPQPVRACAKTEWTPVCVRPERVDSVFFLDSLLPPSGDKSAFADIHFRSGYRYRICFDGRVLALDGASWGGGQETCPKSRARLLAGMPVDCPDRQGMGP